MAQLDWVEPAAAALNADGAWRRLGSTDLVLGLQSGRAVRVVVFEAFEVAAVEAAAPARLRDCDLVLAMTPRQWTDYLRRRAEGRGPSLVALDVARATGKRDETGLARAPNPLARLNFERYHLSLQALVDRGAVIANAG